MQESTGVLEEWLQSHTTGSSTEQSRTKFKDVIIQTQIKLPVVPEKGEKDWMTERVCELSRMKQEARIR